LLKNYLILSVYFLLIIYLSGCRQDTPKEEVVEEEYQPSEELPDTAVDHSHWVGNWEREGAIDPANITITNIDKSQFEFYLNAYDGIKTSEISGVATIEDNLALYMAAGDEDTCRITFLMQDSLLLINQVNKYCGGVTEIDFSGEYFHERYLKDKAMDEDAASRRNKN
jgi:hypothetical protein